MTKYNVDTKSGKDKSLSKLHIAVWKEDLVSSALKKRLKCKNNWNIWKGSCPRRKIFYETERFESIEIGLIGIVQ